MNRLPLHVLCEPLLAQGADAHVEGGESVVTGVCGDSRRVRPGDLFVATPGSQDDGLRHVGEALSRGAVAVLAGRRPDLPEGVAFAGVRDVALAKAQVADRFFGHPSGRLAVVAITGTNGKTTTAAMLRAMLTMEGRDNGLIGTLGAWVGREHVALANTTPDAIELQRLLARMVDANLSTVVMEASSHALDQGRMYGTDVDVAVFTNLSQDHLDYHGDMQTYAAAKARLFEMLLPDATAVLNADDPVSARMGERTLGRICTYGVREPADVTARIQRLDADGTAFRMSLGERGEGLVVATRHVGQHNVANGLAAASAALALGVSPTAIRTGLETLPAVPGRLEPVDCGQDFRVLVDYAHTPDALEKVLELLRPLARGRLSVVFGCGGDRDVTKRPLMGAAAARYADRLYVTSDNPRSEDPAAIIDAVVEGLPEDVRSRSVCLADRREAIAAACGAARGGDIVLVAGKGHETTQTVGDQVLPFDDRQVCREVLWSL